VNWLENEERRKEHNLWILNQRIKELSYREGDIIHMTSSANELTYRPDGTYPSLPDYTSTRSLY
jgi:hypothetical protein